MDFVKRNKMIAIIGTAVFLLLIVGLIVIQWLANRDERASTITNLDSCSRNINDSIKKNINRDLYSYIKSSNDFNGLDSQEKYSSAIRGGTCKTVLSGAGEPHNKTSAIVDIPDAKQSWKISFVWVDSKNNQYASIGSLLPTSGGQVACVSESELRYGDFRCAEVLNYKNAMTMLSGCRLNGDTPGVAGLSGVLQNWRPGDMDVRMAEDKLRTYLATKNSAQDEGRKIACVSGVRDSGVFSVDKSNYHNITRFKVDFITKDGRATTRHDAVLTLTPSYEHKFSLDGVEI